MCFHFPEPKSLDGCNRQFLTVERAIQNQEWPYDNVEDPSFYVARKGWAAHLGSVSAAFTTKADDPEVHRHGWGEREPGKKHENCPEFHNRT